MTDDTTISTDVSATTGDATQASGPEPAPVETTPEPAPGAPIAVRPIGTPKDAKPFWVTHNYDTRIVFAASADEAKVKGLKAWGIWSTSHAITVDPFEGNIVDEQPE